MTSQDSPVVFPPKGFWWLWTIVFLLGLALIFGCVSIVLIGAGAAYEGISLYGLAQWLSAPAGVFAGVVAQSVAEIAVIAYIVLVLPGLAQTSLAGMGFRKITRVQLFVILAGIVLMFVIVTPLASAMESLLHFKQPEEAIAVFTKTFGMRRILYTFFAIILAPVFEESVFRLVLFNAIRHWWGFWPAAILSSILFGLAHAQPPFTSAMLLSISFPLAVGGIVLCWVYARTNNAWSSMITHGGFNALSLILLVLFPQLAK